MKEIKVGDTVKTKRLCGGIVAKVMAKHDEIDLYIIKSRMILQ